jgi:hypothetical protein
MSAGLVLPQLGPLSAAYVLFMAVLGPILALAIEQFSAAITARKAS